MSLATSTQDLFQSDRDLERQAARLKRKNYNIARPIKLAAKILCSALVDQYLYAGDASGKLSRINLESGSRMVLFVVLAPISSLVVDTERKYIILGSWDKMIRVLNFEGVLLFALSEHRDFVKSLCLSQGYLYSGSADGTLYKWDLVDKKLVKSVREHSRSIEGIMPLELHLVTVSSDTRTIYWDDDMRLNRIDDYRHETSVYAMDRSETTIVTGSADETICIRDIHIPAYKSHKVGDWVKTIKILEDFIFIGTRDGFLFVFDTETVMQF